MIACLPLSTIYGLQRQRGAQAQTAFPPGILEALRPEVLETHVEFLAHDLLSGRAPGSTGGDLAALYLATRLQAYGLKPGSGSSFLQWLEFTAMRSTASVVVGAQRRTLALEAGEDFVIWPERAESVTTLDGELIFAGYGIEAPEWNWDDYKGTPFGGKILLVLSNDPGLRDSSIFKGRTLTRYGWWSYKLAQAARVGAAGVLLIHSRETVGEAWDAVRTAWEKEQLRSEREPPHTLRFAGWITSDAARRIVALTGKDYELVLRRAQSREFRPLELGGHLAVDIRSTLRRVRSPNVVGVLEGRDPEMKDEAVVLLAHYDGYGVGRPVRGDSVYNGAVDNAAGVAALLGAAEALGRSPIAPRRSILFLFTTAGEYRFRGAEGYLAQPAFPASRTVAVVNLDMGNLWGTTTDVAGVGAELSTLGESLAQVARAEGATPTPDPEPDKNSFFRSDHLPFAQTGIPSLLLRPGHNYASKPPGWGREQQLRYYQERFHQPQDDPRPEYDYNGLVQQARLVTRLAWLLAQSATYPEWSPSSEFRAAGQRLRQLR
jgi:Zn-dependent M28 family amino/carboxypeptidase